MSEHDPGFWTFATDVVAFVIALVAIAVVTHSMGWWGP
jgi:hypothetical protein